MAVGDWAPLVGVVVGASTTFVVTLLTQRKTDRREDARWAREERARTYEHRRTAYEQFTKLWLEKWNAFDPTHYVDRDQPREPPEDWLVPIWDQVGMVEIYGTRETAGLAQNCFDALFALVFRWNEASAAECEVAMERFREAVRRDLGYLTRVW